MKTTLHVLTPTYTPAGGVVKIMDYVTHAREMGCAVSVYCPEATDANSPLFRNERHSTLLNDPLVSFHTDPRLVVRQDDLLFFSLPSQYRLATASLPRGYSPARMIHIIQGIRHTTPGFQEGYALRVLTRPASRISVNSVIASRIQPWLDPRSLHSVNPIGHDVGYFTARRDGPLNRPLRVGYTTWKSDFGDRVALASGDIAEFRAIRESVDWRELRELYLWADVFLATPGPEEGFYLPGIEAMASGALLITPDVGGNMAYCKPGLNCLLVAYESISEYVTALQTVIDFRADEVLAMRREGSATASSYTLERERAGFSQFLSDLWPRVRQHETALLHG